MIRFMFPAKRSLFRYLRNCLLLFCFILLVTGGIYFPSTLLLPQTAFAKPIRPQNTPVPSLISNNAQRSLFGASPRVSGSFISRNQNTFQARNTQAIVPGQLITETQESNQATLEMPTTTAALPVGGPQPSVTGTKSVWPFAASINDHLLFTITISNNGNDLVNDLEVTDSFPFFLMINSVTTSPYTPDVDIDHPNNQVTVFFQSLDTNREIVIEIDTIVNSTVGVNCPINVSGNYQCDNIAYFNFLYINMQYQGQTNAAPYQILTGTVPPPSGGPVTGQKTVIGSPAMPGDQLGFSIIIRNVGSAPADTLVITDIFPSFLTITNYSTTSGTILVNLNQVIVNVPNLAVNQTVRIDIATLINQNVTGTYSNTATFTYNYQSLAYSGYTNTAFYQIGVAPVLVGQKTVSGSPVAAGDSLVFDIRITNVGSAPANDVVVTDIFPSFLTITRVTTNIPAAHVRVNQQTVEVSLDWLAPDQTLTITISTVVKQGVSASSTNYNVAYFIYTYQNIQYSGYTNSAIYQIGYSSTTGGLPPTGGREIRKAPFAVPTIFTILGGFAFLFGLMINLKKAWKNPNHSKVGSWTRVTSKVFIVFGICMILIACTQGESRISQEQSLPSDNSLPSSPTSTIETTSIPRSPTPVSATATPSSLPDYPIPTPALNTGSDNGEVSFDISPIKRIVITSIDLDTIVKYVPFDGLSWNIAGLNTEVIWMGETSWPGLGGNTGLSAHVSLPDGSDGPFRRLSELKEGDIVELYTEENLYIYTVRSQEIVSISDLRVLQSTDHSQITLITCTDWSDENQVYLNRLIVYSDLVDIKPISLLMSSQ